MKHIPTRRNKFFTFIFSFCPGAAEMYMGFLHNGLSLLAVFMLIVLLCIVFSEAFVVFLALVYIYAFFHAWSIVALDDENFSTSEDVYIWEEFIDGREINLPKEKIRKFLPVAMLLIGIAILWEYVFSIVIKFIPGDYWNIVYPIIKDIPGCVFALLCIIYGFKLLKTKKDELDIDSIEPATEVKEVIPVIECSKEVEAVSADVSSDEKDEAPQKDDTAVAAAD